MTFSTLYLLNHLKLCNIINISFALPDETVTLADKSFITLFPASKHVWVSYTNTFKDSVTTPHS